MELITVEEGHISARITGAGAGIAFQYESGKHCVQRIPSNDRKGRKQTSIVVVGVLPVREDPKLSPLADCDVEITTCGGSGPGGQHQNATDSAVRMRHKPTGLMVFINGRDQQYNRILARRILTARVHDHLKSESDSAYGELRKEQLGNGSRTDKVRTYNFLQSRAADHRFNTKTTNMKGLMKGQFELLFPKEVA